MNEAFAMLVSDCRDSDLPEDNLTVGSRRAAHLDKVFPQIERGELVVGDALETRIHAGLVPIPVLSRLDELELDLW